MLKDESFGFPKAEIHLAKWIYDIIPEMQCTAYTTSGAIRYQPSKRESKHSRVREILECQLSNIIYGSIHSAEIVA